LRLVPIRATARPQRPCTALAPGNIVKKWRAVHGRSGRTAEK